MNFLLIADSFIPQANSAAILINDLSVEIKGKDNIFIVVPNNSIFNKTTVSFSKNKIVFRVRTFNSKSHFVLCRAFSELINPLLMFLAIKFNKIRNYDGIIWYSPSIFFGFIIEWLKTNKNIKSYLILRDIFPQWAVDIGILKKGLVYYFFKFFERYQYSVADRIGIQSISNISFFRKNYPHYLKKVEVLENWMHPINPINTFIDLNKTQIKGRFIFVYAGNFGKSQEIENLLTLVSFFKKNKNFGFLFVGRGSEFERVKKIILHKSFTNVFMLSHVPPQELISVYKQCDIGLISLNLRHTTHNIPGKFISYLLSGLPVIAIVNKGNDLIEIINKNDLGVALSSHNMKLFENKFLKFIHGMNKKKIASRCINFADKNYSPKKAAKQIISFFLA